MIFGHNNRLRAECLQVQPVVCSHSPVFLYQIGGYSINSSKMTGNFPAAMIGENRQLVTDEPVEFAK